MDSNETSKDNILDEANKMEVPDSDVQEMSSNQESTKSDPKNIKTNEGHENENADGSCGETNKGGKDVVESQIKNCVKINTVQNNIKVAKVVSDKSDSESSSMNDMGSLDFTSSDSEGRSDSIDRENNKSTKQIVDTNNVEDTEEKGMQKEIDFKNGENKKDVIETLEQKSTNHVKDVTVDNNLKKEEMEDEKNNKNIKKDKEIKKIEIKKSEEDQNLKKDKEATETKDIDDLKETKKTPEDNESTKIKDNKGLKGGKSGKNATSPKNVEQIKDIKTTNSISTREGTRKRRNTVSSPASEPQQPQTEPQQQQNGSATKRKRLAAGAAVTTVAETSKPVAPGSDRFCWRCHKESAEMQCSTCPRSWHRRCMGGAPPLTVTDWICSECSGVQQAENPETRSPAMALISIEQLCMMLKHVVERMRDQHGSEPFLKAVDLEDVPNYLDYVVKPMDLSLLESNVCDKKYNSTDAFMADAKWIQHNCIVFNTLTSKLTNTAKQMLKIARWEVADIEACPDCFLHGRNLPRPLASWFIEPCRRPHPIVWAKLKGFPFWPAKAMPRLNLQGLVDVRFFGQHDRAWVSPKDVFLYSQEPPSPMPRKKKSEMEECVKEVKEHVKKLERVFGEFKYASGKVLYDPHDPMQIKILLPSYDPVQNKIIISKSEAQVPAADDKVTPAKVERRSVNAKNVVSSANGVVTDTPPTLPEKRRIIRKKRSLSPPSEPSPVASKVRKPSPEIETIVVIPPSPKKSNSQGAVTAKTPGTNNNETKSNVNEGIKNNTSPEIVIVNVNNKNPGIPKPTLVPVKRVRRDVRDFRKIRSMEARLEEAVKKPVTTVKSPNVRKPPPTTVVHAMPLLNNLPSCVEAVDVPSPMKPVTRPVAVLARKSNHGTVNARTPTNGKLPQEAGKAPQSKVVLARSTMKDMAKLPATPVSKIVDPPLPTNNSKPMTTIPFSAKKDQKTMFGVMNSNVSESIKHLNSHKEIKLNAAVTLIKQEPKEDKQISLLKPVFLKKPGKARKSFPNKAPLPRFPQQTSSTIVKLPNTSKPNEPMVYIPSQQNSEVRSATTPVVVSSSSLSSAFELAPPEAGPTTAHIHKNSKDLAYRVAQLIADTIKEAAESNGAGGNAVNSHEAKIHFLKLKIERMKWEHDQEIAELKHNNELVLHELKASMEVERYRALQEARREAEKDKLRCIEETKRKQWCVVCGREAMFFCCWNTAYCDYPCQQKHWAAHVATCAQKTPGGGQPSVSSPPHQPPTKRLGSAAAAKQQQQQVMPKLVIKNPQQTPVMRKA